MKKIIILSLMFLTISFVKAQCYIIDYNSYKKVLKVDGDYVLDYSSYKKLYKFDGEYLIDYSSYKKIAKLECPGRRSALAAAAYYLY